MHKDLLSNPQNSCEVKHLACISNPGVSTVNGEWGQGNPEEPVGHPATIQSTARDNKKDPSSNKVARTCTHTHTQRHRQTDMRGPELIVCSSVTLHSLSFSMLIFAEPSAPSCAIPSAWGF